MASTAALDEVGDARRPPCLMGGTESPTSFRVEEFMKVHWFAVSAAIAGASSVGPREKEGGDAPAQPVGSFVQGYALSGAGGEFHGQAFAVERVVFAQ